MCLPPLEWQTYDIEFPAAKFDDAGKKLEPMTITVWQNGVTIHVQRKVPSKTGAGTAEGPNPLPIKLQDHGNPVVYRNIWIIDTQQARRPRHRLAALADQGSASAGRSVRRLWEPVLGRLDIRIRSRVKACEAVRFTWWRPCAAA